MKPPVWRDDHIYAAPDDPAIEAAFQEAARALTRLDALLADLPDPAHPVADANALRHLLRAIRREANGVKTLAWEIPDPARKPDPEFRVIMEAIRAQVLALRDQLKGAGTK